MPESRIINSGCKWVLPRSPLEYFVFENEYFFACPEAVYYLEREADFLDPMEDEPTEVFGVSNFGKPFPHLYSFL